MNYKSEIIFNSTCACKTDWVFLRTTLMQLLNNQLKMLATLIPNNCVWYVSPLKRAVQTAEALSKYVNYSKMVCENKLIEQNFGDWSGKKISEVWEVLKKSKTKHNFFIYLT